MKRAMKQALQEDYDDGEDGEFHTTLKINY